MMVLPESRWRRQRPRLLTCCALLAACPLSPALAQTAPLRTEPASAEPTIISNEELQREVPQLGPDDPELQGQLESVQEFERRLNTGQGTVATVAPTADPELNRPLPPLNQFDVREVELAQPEPNEGPVELRYSLQVLGLAAVDALTEADLQDQFDDLSALREADGTAANEAQLSARLTEDSALLQRILQSQGWYDARIETRIDRSAAADGQPVTAVLQVAPGERYRIGTIVVQADPTTPPDLIAKNLSLETGEPIVAERIQGAEANVAIILPQEGYPFAQVGQRDVLLDPETHLGD